VCCSKGPWEHGARRAVLRVGGAPQKQVLRVWGRWSPGTGLSVLRRRLQLKGASRVAVVSTSVPHVPAAPSIASHALASLVTYLTLKHPMRRKVFMFRSDFLNSTYSVLKILSNAPYVILKIGIFIFCDLFFCVLFILRKTWKTLTYQHLTYRLPAIAFYMRWW
jgi:hypothetical protein